MVEKLVTIATYANSVEANLAKIKLASEDIDCFLAGEHAVAVYSGAFGEIKLQVKQSDVARAMEVLSQPPDESQFDEFEDEDSTQEPQDEP